MAVGIQLHWGRVLGICLWRGKHHELKAPYSEQQQRFASSDVGTACPRGAFADAGGCHRWNHFAKACGSDSNKTLDVVDQHVTGQSH